MSAGPLVGPPGCWGIAFLRLVACSPCSPGKLLACSLVVKYLVVYSKKVPRSCRAPQSTLLPSHFRIVSAPGPPPRYSKIQSNFKQILNRFWIDFWSIFASMLASCWDIFWAIFALKTMSYLEAFFASIFHWFWTPSQYQKLSSRVGESQVLQLLDILF